MIFSLLILVAVLSLVSAFHCGNAIKRCNSLSHESTGLKKRFYSSNIKLMGARNRAWAKGDLSDKDIFEAAEDEDGVEKKEKFKLDPEVVYFEGPPSPTEILFPALSILTVIGIVPFISALSRQFWVRYKFTSRRVSIQSGIGGKTQTQIIYPDIQEIKFVYRAFGAAGDMVMFLKDGAKVELRHVPNFDDIYNYVLSKCDKECQEKSMKISKKVVTE
jgi:hypothetical protein